jgi:Polyketide cyclase / dehydrase and lipid transport
MASVRKEIETDARPKDAWAAIRDIGALHTRLVPGFVIATRVEPDARIVTFGNGIEIREPIVDLDDAARRLVWSAVGGDTTHYNASVQVFEGTARGSRVVWIADFLPHDRKGQIEAMMEQGMAVMKRTLDASCASGRRPQHK